MPKDRQSLLSYFKDNLNETYSIVVSEEQEVKVELIEVKEGRPNDQMKITSFSLFFQGDQLKNNLPQQMYTLKKGEEYQEALFIIPKFPSETNSFFEIIFN